MDNDRIWNLIAKKLAGEASTSELKELETALRLDPDLHYSLEALQDMWKKQSEEEAAQSEIAFQRHMDRMRSMGIDMGNTSAQATLDEFPDTPNRFQKRKMIAFLSAGFILLFLGYYFLNIRNSSPVVQKPVWEVITRNGSKSNILLPDGSSVWLNAGSRLTYDTLYGNNLREVTLSGEAYFDVVKNPKKPFIIHTGKINIRVLGTIFNVRSYPEEKTIETSLIKGSIEVSFSSQSSKKIILTPNQKLVIEKTEAVLNYDSNNLVMDAPILPVHIQHLSRIGADSVIAETGWMENRLYFNDMSFHELLNSMERKYGVSFQVADVALDTIHFTGSFQNETVTQAMDALRLTAKQSTTGFNYQIKGNQVFIYNNTKSDHLTLPK